MESGRAHSDALLLAWAAASFSWESSCLWEGFCPGSQAPQQLQLRLQPGAELAHAAEPATELW